MGSSETLFMSLCLARVVSTLVAHLVVFCRVAMSAKE
jgi:hypothetical protein